MAEQTPRRRVVARHDMGLGKTLNLASQPLGGYRAFSVCACLAAAMLAATSFALGWSVWNVGGTPQEFVERERSLAREKRELSSSAQAARLEVEDGRSVQILERATLLNDLLVRKGVSWTQTFLDLATVLPATVRILTIQPEVAGEDTLRLDMTVSARNPTDFIEFLRSLEGSEVFQFPVVRGSAPPSEADPTHRYRLTVDYDQQL